MKALRSLLVLVAALSLPVASLAQEAAPAKPPPPPVVSWYGTLHVGYFFNGGTFAAQDAAYQGVQGTSTGGSTYFSARQTRAGMKLNLGDDNALGAAITGLLEFDFMGSNTATNSAGAYNPNIRMRHAWMQAAWKVDGGDLSLVLGQDWDYILNLNPESVVYLANPMFGQSGNMYRRVPQARLNSFTPFGDFGLGAQVAIMSPADTNNASVDNGIANQSRLPAYMGRIYVTMKGDIGGTIGVGAEAETRRFNAGVPATQKDVKTSLIGIDADLNLTQYLQVKGEYFMDKGNADIMAGLVANATQRTVTATGDIVESNGFWAQAVIKPLPLIWVTAGIGQAKIDKNKLDTANGAAAIAATDRLENDSTSVGVICNVSKNWRLGVDYYMTTSKYEGSPTLVSKVNIQQIAVGSQLKF